MADIVFGIVLIFLCDVPSVLGILRSPMKWDQANINCNQSGMMITPIRSVSLPTSIYQAKRTIWTSNYILNTGCKENTDFCTGVYVEQVPIDESYQALCYQSYTRQEKQITTGMKGAFKDACAKSSITRLPYNTNSLVDINDMTSLREASTVMIYETKYWVQSFNIHHSGFVRHCEFYSEFTNATKENKWSISMGNCNNVHQFLCVSGSHYHTVISLISLSTHRMTPPVTIREPNHQHTSYGITYSVATGIISILANLLGLAIIGYLLKRWITNMKNDVIESLRLKYDHQMYEDERVGTEPEPEPQTPVSPGGSSLYDNVIGGNTLQEENLTMSYMMISRDIQHPVTVPTNTIANGSMLTKLTLPQRLPSRENAVRQKSRQCIKPMRRGRTSSKIPTTSTSCQDNTVTPPTGTEKEREFSNGRNFCQSKGKKPKPVPQPDIRTVTLRHKTKQFEQRGTEVINHEFETSSEFSLYLNTAQEAEIEKPEDQDYENIWKDTL